MCNWLFFVFIKKMKKVHLMNSSLTKKSVLLTRMSQMATKGKNRMRILKRR